MPAKPPTMAAEFVRDVKLFAARTRPNVGTAQLPNEKLILPKTSPVIIDLFERKALCSFLFRTMRS